MKQDLCALLRANSYPGRGILLGRSADNTCAVIAYFIMGRSENSRNRVFETTEDGIRTRAFDESKMTDPSLIIYHPVRRLESGLTIVTNGDQTDTIRDALAQGHCYRHALNQRTFEPAITSPSSRAWTETRPAAAGTSSSMIRLRPGWAALSAPTRGTAVRCPPSPGSRWQ